MNFRYPYSRFLCVICGLLIFQSVEAQLNSGQQFIRLDMPNDFPNKTINKVCQDFNGLIWIGTNDGLCRYDSKDKVKIYKAHSDEFPSGLLSNTIQEIVPDSSGHLWIGTKLGGLTKFNQKTNSWKTFKNDPSDSSSLSNNDILSLLLDSQDRLWIGTEKGLNLYVDSLESFIRFIPDPNDSNSLNSKAILSISEDNKGWIWITTWAGGIHLLLTDKDNKVEESKFKVILPPGDESRLSNWTFFNDSQDRYWLGSHEDGLALMQVPTEANNTIENQDWEPAFHYYTAGGYSAKGPSSNFILDIIEDKHGDLWIGTVHGLNRIDQSKLPNSEIYNSKTLQTPKLEFEQNFYSLGNPKSISNNYIRSINEDRQGLIWIGTEVGLNLYNRQTNRFETETIIVSDYPTLENEVMTYVNDNDLMLVLNHGDVVFYDQMKDRVSDNVNFPDITDGTSLFRDGDKSIFISRRSGISQMSLNDYSLKDFKIPEWLSSILSKVHIKSLIKDSHDRIWLGSGNGLFMYNLIDGSAVALYTDLSDKYSITDNAISDVFEDSFGNIWVGTYQGLNKLIEEDGTHYKFKPYLYDDSNPNESLPFNTVIDIEELNGELYIGSESGFFSLNIATDKFTNITKNKSKYTIRSIQITENENIWASTSDGIVVYYPITDSFAEFEEADGVSNTGFLRRSKSLAKDGYIYFGGRTGYTKFNPAKFSRDNVMPEVHITEVLEMSQEGNTERNLTHQDHISLFYTTYYLSISFSSTNHSKPEQNKFAYQLEGFTDEWTYTSQTTPIVYTNLDAGEYVFKIKTSNQEGRWNEHSDSLMITIYPAFWDTWWFKFVSFLLFCLLIWFLFHFYTRKIKMEKEKLSEYNENLNIEITERKKVEKALQERELYMEQLVDERTAELSVKNKKVKSLLSQLEVRNDELEQIVKKRTANLTQSNQELLRSNKDLEQFAFISSHDLKEPLRTVGTFTSLLNKKFDSTLDPRAKEYLGYITEGVDRMSELIESLLSYSTVGNKDIELQKVDLAVLLEEILKDFTRSVDDKRITITKDALPTIVCDKVQMGMVFRNLTTNAIKFNDKKDPRIHIGMNPESDDFWYFYVKDNGIGIDPEYQSQIFELFKRLHRKAEYEGTGIGLAMCQKVIIRHQGSLSVDSTKNIGSTFSFSIKKDLKSNYTKLKVIKSA